MYLLLIEGLSNGFEDGLRITGFAEDFLQAEGAEGLFVGLSV